ncbi:hypothetical protein D3C80_2020930 [compost metagenome]
MAVGNDAHAREVLLQGSIGMFNELRYPAHGHADVVLEAWAFMILRLGNTFAQRP